MRLGPVPATCGGSAARADAVGLDRGPADRADEPESCLPTEELAPGEPVSAIANVGIAHTAAPTPSITASAPTRPTYAAEQSAVGVCPNR